MTISASKHDLAMEVLAERLIAQDLRAERDALVEALNELDANCENRQDEPFVKYVRQTARAALARVRGE